MGKRFGKITLELVLKQVFEYVYEALHLHFWKCWG